MRDLDLVDWPLEEWAFSRALFPIRLIQERCAHFMSTKWLITYYFPFILPSSSIKFNP